MRKLWRILLFFLFSQQFSFSTKLKNGLKQRVIIALVFELYLKDQSYDNSLFEAVLEFGRKRELLAEQEKKQYPPELSHDDLKSMLDQLIEFNILSPTFSDTFLINQERTAYVLAKEAFLKLSKQFVHKPHA